MIRPPIQRAPTRVRRPTGRPGVIGCRRSRRCLGRWHVGTAAHRRRPRARAGRTFWMLRPSPPPVAPPAPPAVLPAVRRRGLHRRRRVGFQGNLPLDLRFRRLLRYVPPHREALWRQPDPRDLQRAGHGSPTRCPVPTFAGGRAPAPATASPGANRCSGPGGLTPETCNENGAWIAGHPLREPLLQRLLRRLLPTRHQALRRQPGYRDLQPHGHLGTRSPAMPQRLHRQRRMRRRMSARQPAVRGRSCGRNATAAAPGRTWERLPEHLSRRRLRGHVQPRYAALQPATAAPSRPAPRTPPAGPTPRPAAATSPA